MRWFYRIVVLILQGFFNLFYRLSVYGSKTPYQGKAIIAPNHASFLDPPVIGATWPEEVHFLARASLFRYGGWKSILKNLNAHPVHGTAQDIESFRLICLLLSEGKKVVIFPEGERTLTGSLMPIKSGAAMLALRMECPIIPVYLKGTYKAWPRHKLWPCFGSSIACVYGQPIFPEDFPKMGKKQLQDHFTAEVQKKWEELQFWLEAGANGTPP